MQEVLQQVLSEVRSAWRFRWYAVIAAWTVAVLGLAVVAWLPNIYQASARIYVDGSSVLRPLLNDRIVPQDVATHLLYVRQALLAREYLEKVATENGLIDTTTSPAARDRVINRMQQDAAIEATAADGGNGRASGVSSVFTIGFRDKRPEVAAGIVRSMMNALIEDTLGANREGTDMATRFLDERIAEHETRLEKAEQALAEFQRANSGRLPGSRGTYFERMQRERDELEKTRRDLRLAESKRERLKQQITSQSPLMLDDPGINKQIPANSIDARIRDQHAQLDKLLLQYTEKHPAVIALKESLQQLEAQRAEQLRALGIADSDQQISALGSNPVYQATQIALNDVEVQISTLDADAHDREKRLKDLQALIDEVPRVEAELARLNRDYSVINEQYQALIQSREKQQLSQQASASDQVEFRVLNPPRTDPKPVAPKRILLLAVVLAAALVGGAGLSYQMSQMRPVFSTARALQEISGFPVIGSVSRVLLDPTMVSKRRMALASFSAAMIGLVVLIAGLALFEYVGPGVHALAGGA